jgi:glycosyltransferase involved in cell wall biosynthesis
MMKPPSVAYDVTRLATRVINSTPNGIDRIDIAFAKHFFGNDHLGLMMTLLGPRLITSEGARGIADGISRIWREDENPNQGGVYEGIVEWIAGGSGSSCSTKLLSQGRQGRVTAVLRWIGQHGFPIGRCPAKAMPQGAIFLNVSQFPLWVAPYFHWLKKRPDVKPVFFIHDLLPIEMPEYFRPAEYHRHLRRLQNLATFGAGAIVTTQVVRAALERQLSLLGRRDMPIHVAPIPAAPIFSQPEALDPRLTNHPYFVICGTIEPRKNHLMLLHVWRELVLRYREAAPKLVIVGTRGWENENVLDLLDRCRALREHVIEVSGLSTPCFKRLLVGARALLMPSFAEGYGLPLIEAQAANVPVIASDIPVFRESAAGRVTFVSPIHGEQWLETIRSFALQDSVHPGTNGKELEVPLNWDVYFSKVEKFLAAL